MSLGYTFLGCPLLLNIDNKEILYEILNYSIDVLLGNSDEHQMEKHCHKYGFQNVHDFMLLTRKIARVYRSHYENENATEAELLYEFNNLSPEFQRLVPAVYEARKSEIGKYMMQLHNAQDHPLVLSFDYDARVVLGDSSFAQNFRELVRIYFHCCDANGKLSKLSFEMDPGKLNEFIATLELSLATEKNKIC
ncbi:uncharacterized protein LOC118752428 [Rhagoletis pomonella]|uniref:uncharacterized protein LOC118752351 n=1 Tax=Rhagoletis pomonella TaxID=28610 RepID=UPI0017812952|nr:uncharacterized protein LOC118752351 [Rhagoletis pomonella]XP_036343241.1 uncharacterized protein LOC118752428 [Rhagoletis pomonella]